MELNPLREAERLAAQVEADGKSEPWDGAQYPPAAAKLLEQHLARKNIGFCILDRSEGKVEGCWAPVMGGTRHFLTHFVTT